MKSLVFNSKQSTEIRNKKNTKNTFHKQVWVLYRKKVTLRKNIFLAISWLFPPFPQVVNGR